MIANTVHIRITSLYHATVYLSGMGFGPRKFFSVARTLAFKSDFVNWVNCRAGKLQRSIMPREWQAHEISEPAWFDCEGNILHRTFLDINAVVVTRDMREFNTDSID